MIKIEINQEQLRSILNKINPQYQDQATRSLIRKMGGRGRTLAKKYLKPVDSNRGTDYAQKSVRYEVKNMTATVFTVMPDSRTRSIEEGRPPGGPVNFKSIARWYEGNLYLRTSTINAWPRDKRETVSRIVSVIERSGAKGKQFLSKTYQKLIDDMPKELARIAKAIEKRWGA